MFPDPKPPHFWYDLYARILPALFFFGYLYVLGIIPSPERLDLAVVVLMLLGSLLAGMIMNTVSSPLSYFVLALATWQYFSYKLPIHPSRGSDLAKLKEARGHQGFWRFFNNVEHKTEVIASKTNYIVHKKMHAECVSLIQLACFSATALVIWLCYGRPDPIWPLPSCLVWSAPWVFLGSSYTFALRQVRKHVMKVLAVPLEGEGTEE